MDKETAIKKAAGFKDDWEIDPKKRKGFHKPTGFEIYMGSVWRNAEGMHYDAVIGYRAGNYPDRKETKEEKEEESRRIHEEAEQARAEFQAQVAKEEEWRRTHPEEYQKEIEQNIRNYFAKMQQDDEKWYHDRGREMPEESKERYAKKTEEMIEKFHREQAARNNIDR